MAILFGILSLTDFFDGYLARRYQQVTTLGKILDPIADKFLIYSTLIALLAAGKIYFYWVVILIGREIFVMGLRQIALESSQLAPVYFLGKLKTVFQMVCLPVIIINPYQKAGWTNTWNITEQLLLFATILISIVSARSYYISFLKEYIKSNSSDPAPVTPAESLY